MISVFHIFAFIIGSMFGSFCGVLIYRIPRNIDTIFKRSHCENCKRPIAWYSNVPILGFIFLRGKCKDCGYKISFRYFVIEIICGAVFVLFFPKQIDSNSLLYYAFYCTTFLCFLVHFFIDIDFKILPDRINVLLFVMFLSYGVLHFNWMHWAIGGSVGFLMPLLVSEAFYRLKNVEGMGGGDIKLYGVLGLYLGPLHVLYNIFFSCTLGAIFALLLMTLKKMDKNTPIPFGPFIILVAAFQIFTPDLYYRLMKLLGFLY